MIQKITPKKFVADKDQRLVAANEMILAQNVTISERADGSSSILKTMKGTDAINEYPGEPTPTPTTWKVVGSVTDNQRGKVYAFVYDTADNTDHRIIEAPVNFGGLEYWRTVFKDQYLNFNESYPVKADLINKAFQQDGNVQTVMYFTDNNNPPRKINIDRALAGDYTDEVDEDGNQISELDIDLDYAILTMRGAPTDVPTFSFEKDPALTTNNFTNDTFQFACQYLYKDGEESALSGYSPLATAPYLASKSLVSSTANSSDVNACLINIPWKADEDNIIYSDVSKVRLLGRSGNSNPFFIIDEFDPNQDLTKDVGDVADKEVYSAQTSVYRFYNDGYYANISDVTASKLYDNVPQKAEGQTIGASRLLYSNYEEGYPNYDVSSSVTLSVNYGAESDFGGDFLGDINEVISYPNNPNGPGSPDAVNQQNRGEVHFDLRKSVTGINWPGGSVGDDLDQIELPVGTKIRLSFKVDVSGEYYAATGHRYGRITYTSNNGDYKADLAISAGTKIDITNPNRKLSFEVDYTASAGDTVQDVYDSLKAQLNKGSTARYVDFTVPNLKYKVTETSVPQASLNEIITALPKSPFTSIPMQGRFYFGATDVDGIDGVFRMFLSLRHVGMPLGTSYFDRVQTLVFNVDTQTSSATTVSQTSNITQASQQVILVDNGYLTSRSGNTESSGSGPSFKHGSTHDLGIVYYDKWGRNGFVNRIGSVYAKHPSERLPIDNKGGVSIDVSISDALDSSLPDFADSYQFVYGGSQYSNVVQYTTGGAYMTMEGGGDSAAPANTLVENDHRIYVSLNTLDQFQNETGSFRQYSFTEGDICRVISYSEPDGTIEYASANDGSIIEFEVAGVEFLSDTADLYKDGEGNPIQWDSGAGHRRGTFLVLRAPRVDGNVQVRVLKLIANADIEPSSTIANGTADTTGDTSGTVTVTRDGVDITSSVTPPSFSGINVTGTGTSLDAIVVDAVGNGIKAGDVITFSCASESSIDVTITVASTDLKEEGLKYEGFDWFSVVNYWKATSQLGGSVIDYPDTTTPSSTQPRMLWGAESVILTPKKVSETPIYYEIGDRIKIKDTPAAGEGKHGPTVTLSEGDVQLRPVSCKSPEYNTPEESNWDIARFKNWDYVTKVIENQTPAEFITEKAWGKGRVHATFERAATVNRYNSITYSQPYADDTSVLSLSSFVPSQGNFFDLPSEHGACTFLGISSDQLIAMQENKVSRLGLNKDVLETGTQAGVVTISSQLINNLVSYAGDFGTSNPESVLIRDGIVYFADVARRAIVKLSSNGLEVISNKDISSLVEENMDLWEGAGGKTIVSGFDPEDNIYYITLSPQGSFNGYTLGYDEKGGFWQGNYTFYADRYASLKDRFFAFKSGGTGADSSILHEFRDLGISNVFFGSTSSSASKIRVVFNANPSMVKAFNAVSVESKTDWSVKVFNSEDVQAVVGSSSEREGQFYRSIGGLLSSPNTRTGPQFLPLGTVASATNLSAQGTTSGTLHSDITFQNSLRGMHIPEGYHLYKASAAGTLSKASTNAADYPDQTPVVSSTSNRSDGKIRFTPAYDLTPADDVNSPPTAGMNLFIAHPTVGYTTEKVRDNYIVVELSFTPFTGNYQELVDLEVSGEELYAINAHFSNSPLNDAIG